MVRQLIGSLLLCLAISACAVARGRQELTAVPKGPFHVEGNQLLDSARQPFLIRGTSLPEFRAKRADDDSAYGPFSGTILSVIRQRWNMNAIRIPLNVADFETDPQYLQHLEEVIARANQVELVVILAPHGRDQEKFWTACAVFFRGDQELMFEIDPENLPYATAALHEAGAVQVLITPSPGEAHEVQAIAPSLQDLRTDQDRNHLLSRMAGNAPVIAIGLDPLLDQDSGGCVDLPSDPSEAEALVQATLDWFDIHQISWIVSEFRPGRLIADYHDLYATSLENGWTCGRPDRGSSGIGEVIQFHLWGSEIRGNFVLGAAGSFVLARGEVAIVYGAVFAEQDTRSHQSPPPPELSHVSVLITDSAGVTHRSGLLYVSAGWGQANFIVPDNCAPGPAILTVRSRDGSRRTTPLEIADVAPGLWTGRANGRGPVIGFVGPMPIWRCRTGACSTVPIPVPRRGGIIVRLEGSGIRHARTLSDFDLKIGDKSVPVIAFGPTDTLGVDQLTIRIPSTLRGLGEADLLFSIRGRLSNVVRINLGRTVQTQ